MVIISFAFFYLWFISCAIFSHLLFTIFVLFFTIIIIRFRATRVCSCIICTFLSFLSFWLLFRFGFLFNNRLWIKVMLLLHFSSVFYLCHLDIRQFRLKISLLHFLNLSFNFSVIQRLVLFVVITIILNFRFFRKHA